MAGLDPGVAKPVTPSDGTVFEPVNGFQKNQTVPASVKSQSHVQRQLAEAEVQNSVSAFPHHQYPQGLPSQTRHDSQQQPRSGSH